MCSSRWVALIPVRQTQSLLQKIVSLVIYPVMLFIMEGGLKYRSNSFFYLVRINGYLLSNFCRVSAFIGPLFICFTVELTLIITPSCSEDEGHFFPTRTPRRSSVHNTSIYLKGVFLCLHLHASQESLK